MPNSGFNNKISLNERKGVSVKIVLTITKHKKNSEPRRVTSILSEIISYRDESVAFDMY